MKIAAITMVYKDYWALARWYDHYGKLLGPENLYIVAHGRDDEVSRICPDASVTVIPRDNLEGFDQQRAKFLNQFKDALCVFYDRVIRTDTDELIVLDPERFGSFADVFDAHRGPAVFALGLDVVEENGAHWAVFNSHYSKAWTARAGMQLLLHGVRVNAHKLANMQFVMPKGVYLVHLKYANAAALDAANTVRQDVANRPGKGLPGLAWQEPEKIGDKFLSSVRALPEATWEEARDAAYKVIANRPKRDEKFKVVRPKFFKPVSKARPPAWIF